MQVSLRHYVLWILHTFLLIVVFNQPGLSVDVTEGTPVTTISVTPVLPAAVMALLHRSYSFPPALSVFDIFSSLAHSNVSLAMVTCYLNAYFNRLKK